jgi:hypothetical protein
MKPLCQWLHRRKIEEDNNANNKNPLLFGWCSKKMKIASPLARAAISQLIALICNTSLFYVLQTQFSIFLPIWAFVLIQGSFAALLSIVFRLEWWWQIINILLPVAGAILIALQVPAIFFLCIFLGLLLLYLPAFLTRVPYFPSKKSLYPILLDLFPKGKSIQFIDVGSGFGGVLLNLAKERKDCHFLGVEFAPFPWLISWFIGKIKKSSVKFKFCKYETVNFHDFDIVFAYLSPAVMPLLWEKVRVEMRTGSLFLSYEFPVPMLTPDLTINLNPNEPILYGWRI